MKVILNPSGSVTANAQSPHGVSDGSRSSVQPFSLTRPASSLMSWAVDTHSRNPSPFLRSRPLAKSSWPSMMSQAPAFICMPRRPPFVSQRSPGVNPSTSRYQATLSWRSLTVNEAAMERSRKDSGCWRGARLGLAGLRAGRVAFFFFVAIVDSSLGSYATGGAARSVASCAAPRQITTATPRTGSIPNADQSSVSRVGREAQGRERHLHGRQWCVQGAVQLRDALRGQAGHEPRGAHRRGARRLLQYGALGGAREKRGAPPPGSYRGARHPRGGGTAPPHLPEAAHCARQ